MPKTSIISTAFDGLGAFGRFATTLTSLLAITAVIWMIWLLVRRGRRALPIALAAMLVFNFAGLLFAPSAAATLIYHLIVIAALFMILRPVGERTQGTAWILLPAFAIFASELHQAVGALSNVLGAERPIELGLFAFVAGEALVVASGFAFGWWMRPNREERWIWIAAAVPSLAFVSLYLGAPAISGVLAIWSIGLTLFLPWPLYALSLWACTAAILTGLKRGHPAGLAIAMLVAGGYASQQSPHLFLALVALYVLADKDEPIDLRMSERVKKDSAPMIKLRPVSKVES